MNATMISLVPAIILFRAKKFLILKQIKNNGLKINNETVGDEKKIISQDNFDQDNNIKVSHGKKQHVIVKII